MYKMQVFACKALQLGTEGCLRIASGAVGAESQTNLTKCRETEPFAYTRVLGRRARIASDGLDLTFIPSNEKKRLNQVCTEIQCVTIQNYKFKIRN